MKISIAKDFTRTPGSRYKKEGEFSGELFRETILKDAVREAIKKNEKLTIILDGVAGYGTSFLEESFGGLIREDHIPYEDLIKTLIFVSKEEPYLENDIVEYIEDAAKETSVS
ncbi:STAS-like domain-containing protein [Pontibacter litorisediminis]|uniref:STAS-like domain-containing protein n=1 Tax=Pontibacter litorisediminis TaxID=1846260 RepID=UPI0023ED6280|nr:STAS-like domain-containing protein [Pontibacter litorisediminis]